MEVVVFSGRFHFWIATIIWLIISANNFDDIWHWVNPFFYLLGTMFPDTDHPKAPLSGIFPLWTFFSHRGFTHTVYGMLLFSGLISLWEVRFGVSFAVGYYLHLLFDSTTPSGVNWWFRKKKRA